MAAGPSEQTPAPTPGESKLGEPPRAHDDYLRGECAVEEAAGDRVDDGPPVEAAEAVKYFCQSVWVRPGSAARTNSGTPPFAWFGIEAACVPPITDAHEVASRDLDVFARFELGRWPH